jgi:hypothetical protein
VASPVNPGKVEWSGENPGIYLKDAEGRWQTLAVYFRVVTSPHGPGRGIVLIGATSTAAGHPEAPNLCLSDNEPLMRWLVADFVSRFASFRDSAGLRAMSYHAADHFDTTGDGRTFHQEQVAGNGLEVTLRWDGRPMPGKVIQRDFLDRRMSTAFLAFSETWIKPVA